MIAHARTTDPETSHEAAASVTKLRESQEAVLSVLRLAGKNGELGMTDVALVHRYGYVHSVWPERYPRQSESGLRTRRKELVALGKVEDSGSRVRLMSGRRAIVWSVVQ